MGIPPKEGAAERHKSLGDVPQGLRRTLARLGSLPRRVAHRVVSAAHQAIRNRLFDKLGRVPGADFAYVGGGRERYLVNCHDRVISRIVFATGGYEFDKFERALRLLRVHTAVADVDLLVDVGANIGTVCLPAVARGLVRAAVGIEPHPVNCSLLRANVALNSANARVTVHECAVGAEDGETLMLELSNENWGDHRIAVSHEDGSFGEAARQQLAVRSMRLDGLVTATPGKSMLIWMDTQGYEGFVLKGATALLAARVPIVAEFWPYGMRRAGSYALFREQLAGYRGFIDLSDRDPVRRGGLMKDYALRPLSDLGELHDALDVNARSFTDLLIV